LKRALVKGKTLLGKRNIQERKGSGDDLTHGRCKRAQSKKMEKRGRRAPRPGGVDTQGKRDQLKWEAGEREEEKAQGTKRW